MFVFVCVCVSVVTFFCCVALQAETADIKAEGQRTRQDIEKGQAQAAESAMVKGVEQDVQAEGQRSRDAVRGAAKEVTFSCREFFFQQLFVFVFFVCVGGKECGCKRERGADGGAVRPCQEADSATGTKGEGCGERKCQGCGQDDQSGTTVCRIRERNPICREEGGACF